MEATQLKEERAKNERIIKM